MSSSYYVDNVDTSYGISNTTGLLSVFAGIGTFMIIFSLAVSVFIVVSMWKIFTKAGKPGWTIFIPIYNIYIMCEIAEKEWWYILLLCIPLVQIYAMFVIYDGIAKKFGKTTGFTIGMILLPFIFIPMLAFGKNSIYLDSAKTSVDSNFTSPVEQTPVEEVTIQSNPTDSFISQPNTVTPSNEGYVAPTFDTPVVESAPIISAPVVEPTPMMSEPVAPVVEPAPMMSEPVAPVVESAPIMSEPVAPAVEPAPMMSEPVAPAVEPAPIMSEPVAPAVEPAPMMSEPVAPVVEPAPMMSEPVAPVVEPTPIMSEPVAPVVESAPIMSEPVTPVVEPAPMMVEPVAPVVEPAPMMSEPVVPQQEVNQSNSGAHTSLWSNNNNNNGQM